MSRESLNSALRVVSPLAYLREFWWNPVVALLYAWWNPLHSASFVGTFVSFCFGGYAYFVFRNVDRWRRARRAMAEIDAACTRLTTMTQGRWQFTVTVNDPQRAVPPSPTTVESE